MSGSIKKLEQILEILSEDVERAEELLHEFVVENAREAYQRLLEEDDEDIEDFEDEIESEETGEIDELDDDGTDDIDSEVDVDDVDGFVVDDENDAGDDLEDKLDDIEDQLEELRAEFEALVSEDGDVETDVETVGDEVEDGGGGDFDDDLDLSFDEFDGDDDVEEVTEATNFGKPGVAKSTEDAPEGKIKNSIPKRKFGDVASPNQLLSKTGKDKDSSAPFNKKASDGNVGIKPAVKKTPY